MKHSKSFKIIIAILIAITLFLAFSQNSFALSYNIDNKSKNVIEIIVGKYLHSWVLIKI